MGSVHDNDGWLDTINTEQRRILDLRTVGMRHALTLGRFHYNSASEQLEEMRHDSWLVLIFVLAGGQHYRVDSREVEVRGGQGLRILPGQRYSTGGWPEQRGDLAWLILKTRPLPRGRALGMDGKGARAVFERRGEARERLARATGLDPNMSLLASSDPVMQCLGTPRSLDS